MTLGTNTELVLSGTNRVEKVTKARAAMLSASNAITENALQREAEARALLERLIMANSPTFDRQAVVLGMQQLVALRKEFDDREAALEAFHNEIDELLKFYRVDDSEGYGASLSRDLRYYRPAHDQWERLMKEKAALDTEPAPAKGVTYTAAASVATPATAY